MKIVFFETSNFEKEKFNSYLGKINNLLFFDNTIQENALNDFFDADAICIFVHSKVTKDIISKMPNLTLICTRSTGIDHIDIEECKKRKIEVKNVPFYGENTVAEHTFALILSLSRQIHKSYVRTTEGEFSTEGLQGFDLKDKTLGIIGGGKIGLHVARIAKSFGMHVRVYDIKHDVFMSELINFKYSEFDKILKQSDIITLHLPLTPSTKHIINKNTIKSMKNGVLLINTARGALIDTVALIKAISDGKIGGAGLDVIEGEELLIEENIFNLPSIGAAKIISQSKELLKNENVVLTPHNAFNSVEAVNRIIDTTIYNLQQ